MADPTDVGRLGHRYFPIVKNASTGEEEFISRAQSIEFGTTHTTEKMYELGRVGPVGSAQDPTDLRCTWEVNLYEELRSEFVLSGKDVDVDTSYNLGDVTDEDDNEAFVLIRDTDGNLTDEVHYTECVTSELSWRFAVGAVCATTVTVEGTSGSWLTTPIHGAQTLDSTSIGGAKGKDARIWFGSAGSTPTAADRAYRLQSFNIRATPPVQTVRELGRRNIVGKLLEPWDVTVDFDVAAADEQPHDKFYNAIAGGFDLSDTTTQHIFVRLYDPDAAEATSVIRAWEIHNCRPTATTPVRAQVRGLSTYRYTLTSELEAVTDSGGLIAYKGDIA
jgi:hypothetical protein